MLQLALIFGGRSAEHEISLASARFVAAMLDRDKYDVVPVGITRDGRWVQPARSRGGAGRRPRRRRRRAASISSPTRRARGCSVADGSFQPARLRLSHHARHVRRGRHHPGSAGDGRPGLRRLRRGLASAVGMDKEIMKAVFAARGLPQVEYVVLRDGGRHRPRGRGGRRGAPAVPGVRQAGQPRLQRGHDQGARPRRARRRRSSWPPPTTARSSSRPRRRAARSSARCSATRPPRASVAGEVMPGQRVLRLRGQVHGGHDVLRHPRRHRRREAGRGRGRWPRPPSRPSTAAGSRAATSSSSTTGACSSTRSTRSPA